VHDVSAVAPDAGARIWCKRDDLTGFALGGNKTRKLDFLLPEALAAGCDTIVGVGGSQSNFCRIAAAYGTANGMEVHFVLGGAEPAEATGNLLLMHLSGATCHHVDTMNWDDWVEESKVLEAELARSGRHVYRIPVGGSTPLGALGYVKAFAEILEDEERLGVRFERIFVASGSAGTQAGLVAGKAISGWPGEIAGISVADPAEELGASVLELARRTCSLLGTRGDPVVPEHVIVDDGHIGRAYGARTPAAEAAIEAFARTTGVLLDHVYTGKAAAGMMAWLVDGAPAAGSARATRREGPSTTGATVGAGRRDRDVLFVHTGGVVELFE
jgi:1-aminocyclopropane-1-carboxylate deaminase/D-cysteine desulfhydrase-like pyridoxal-dependent ACC family enzyme